jgi:hypothetical protein
MASGLEWCAFKVIVIALVVPGGNVSRSKAYSKAPATRKRTAEIINTGSTNFAGYKVIVEESGHAKYIPGKGRQFQMAETELEGDLKRKTVRKFFADIDAAGALSKLPPSLCLKSISFGTSTYIAIGEDKSPDLSCPGRTPIMDALYTDAQAILDELNATRSPLQMPNGGKAFIDVKVVSDSDRNVCFGSHSGG